MTTSTPLRKVIRPLAVAVVALAVGGAVSLVLRFAHPRATMVDLGSSALLTDLESTDVAVRRRAVRRLGDASAEATGAIAALSSALRDSDQHVRSGAARSLGRLEAKSDAALDALLRAATDDDAPFVRQFAIDAIGRAGRAACRLCSAIEAAVHAGSINVGAALAALRAMGDCSEAVRERIARPAYLGALARRLHSSSALHVIESLILDSAESCAAALPDLVVALSDDQAGFEFREHVANVLGLMGAAAREAVPALERSASNGSEASRAALERIQRGELGDANGLDPGK